MIRYEVLLSEKSKGIYQIAPSGGWSSCRSFKIKMRCEHCGYETGPLAASSSQVAADTCCHGTGQFKITSLLHGARELAKIKLFQAEAKGLQPCDNFLEFDTTFVATDEDGKRSSEFNIAFDDCKTTTIDLEFPSGRQRSLELQLKLRFDRLVARK